jgi:uncharacterized protein YdeI (YjbR/CyaY-like superfamily)
MLRHTSVDAYIDSAPRWQSELKALRRILLSSGLVETIKWGGPCYTTNERNVVGIAAFKSYFGLWFFQGALLKDESGLLVNAQDGRTRAQRQWRMKSADDIKPALIRRYVREAIAITRSGREIKADRSKPIIVPTELKAAFAADRKAGSAYSMLRPGLQREYAEYISDAKRDETRQRRVAKILPMIVAGVSLNDKYR